MVLLRAMGGMDQVDNGNLAFFILAISCDIIDRLK